MLERNLAGQGGFLRRHAASPARPEVSRSMVEVSGMEFAVEKVNSRNMEPVEVPLGVIPFIALKGDLR